jgi:HEAT repeats
MRTWIVFALLLGAAGVLGFELVRRPASPSQPRAAVTVQDDAAAAPATAARGLVMPRWTPPPTPRRDAELDQIFARLTQAPDDAAYHDAMAAVYFDLVARIRSQPELIGKLEAMLGDGDRHTPAVRVAVGALAGAGTPEAQAALVRVLDARHADRSFVELLVPTMGFAKRPTPVLEGALRRLAASDAPGEVREMAHLAMGNAASRLQAEDPARAKGIVDEYDAKLAKAVRADEVGTYLSALGNAGTPEAGRVVARYLDDERPEVRAGAVDALRLVPTAQAEAELRRALRDDPVEDVRAVAARALAYRHPSPAEPDKPAALGSDVAVAQ